jgi:Skp family chaperone for outer membrane proteins
MIKSFIKPALAAAFVPALAIAVPAAAQVNGMAVTEPAVAVASSQALQSGFQQIATTYAAQITQRDQLSAQRNQLLQTLDTNGDGQVDEAEQATLTADNPTVVQINTLDDQINAAQAPIQLAQAYVVSQLGQQYGAAVQQVITDRSIQVLLSPEAVVYAADGMDVTQFVVTALNARVPSVTITPPAGWQPNQAIVNLYQQVQQVFAIARQQQQAAGANGAAAPATEGR